MRGYEGERKEPVPSMGRYSAAIVAVGFALAACSTHDGPVNKSGASSAGSNVDVIGAGASFPYPLYSKWMYEYYQANPRIRVSYQSIGSGGGIRQISANTVDFGATDAPVTDSELAKIDGELVHVPMTIGAVAVIYNLDGVRGLVLGPDELVAIYAGDITRWNDARLAALNPGLPLPDSEITVAYRSDGSGTTAVFTDYLAAVSPAWKADVGAGKAVRFPTGLGAKGNEGVAGQVKTTPGTIGYVELAYAIQTKLSYARLRNRAGTIVGPTLESISAAAAGAIRDMPDDYRVSIVNAPGEEAYPISAFTYILVYRDMRDEVKARALVEFLWWAVHEGQSMGPELHYARLPDALVERIAATLKSLTAKGKPILRG